MGRRTANDKRDLYASTAVKFGMSKGQDGEVVRQVQGEDQGPEGRHFGRGTDEGREVEGGEG